MPAAGQGMERVLFGLFSTVQNAKKHPFSRFCKFWSIVYCREIIFETQKYSSKQYYFQIRKLLSLTSLRLSRKTNFQHQELGLPMSRKLGILITFKEVSFPSQSLHSILTCSLIFCSLKSYIFPIYTKLYLWCWTEAYKLCSKLTSCRNSVL